MLFFWKVSRYRLWSPLAFMNTAHYWVLWTPHITGFYEHRTLLAFINIAHYWVLWTPHITGFYEHRTLLAFMNTAHAFHAVGVLIRSRPISFFWNRYRYLKSNIGRWYRWPILFGHLFIFAKFEFAYRPIFKNSNIGR